MSEIVRVSGEKMISPVKMLNNWKIVQLDILTYKVNFNFSFFAPIDSFINLVVVEGLVSPPLLDTEVGWIHDLI